MKAPRGGEGRGEGVESHCSAQSSNRSKQLSTRFLYVTGAVEVVAALLLLVPRTATLGAGLVLGTMVGAVLTHLKAGETAQLVGPLILLGLGVIVGLARRDEVVAPFNRFLARDRRAGEVRA